MVCGRWRRPGWAGKCECLVCTPAGVTYESVCVCVCVCVCVQVVADRLGRPAGELNLIVCHLGSGASMACIRRGR